MKQVRISVIMLLVMSVLLGILYPLAMTGIARALFAYKAGGSLVAEQGVVIGSGLIGQSFTGERYFHGRPSAGSYDGTASGGSNFGPTSRKFIDQVAARVEQVRRENGLPIDAKVPADLVLASGSGLDPHISLEAALVQADRIARARNIDKKDVLSIIRGNIIRPYAGLFGTPYVNVLALNRALDRIGKKQ